MFILRTSSTLVPPHLLQVKNQHQQSLDATRLFEDMEAFKDVAVFVYMAATSSLRPLLKSLIPHCQNILVELLKGAEIEKKDVYQVSKEAKKSLISIQCVALVGEDGFGNSTTSWKNCNY